MKIGRIVSIMLLMVVTAGVAFSEPPPAPPDGKRDKLKEEYREKMKERVFLIMALQLADEMDLPQDREDKFLSRFRDHYNDKNKVAEQQLELMMQLKALQDSEKSDINSEKISEQLVKIEENRKKRLEIDDDFNSRMKEILTPEQQAKLLIALPRIQQNVMEQIKQERERRGREDKKDGKGGKPNAPKGKKNGSRDKDKRPEDMPPPPDPAD